MPGPHEAPPAVGVRWPELLVALLLLAGAVLVIVDSLRVGIGWADDGPRSGYFPFYIGIGLLASSGWIALKQVLNWDRNGEFAERAQLAMVWAILWPMVVYVALIEGLGIYVASFVLIGYFMVRHGRHGVLAAAGVSLGVPLVCFFVFERWFLVSLPKGPLEALLGL
jgi:hypothetical protein